jgi:hypothetical protein
MIEKDEFDFFLENEFKKSSYMYHDDGFRQKILERIPAYVRRNRSRNLIIYGSAILSCILFILFVDQNIVKDTIIEISGLIEEINLPSLQSIVFITFLLFIAFLIPRIEYNKGIR